MWSSGDPVLLRYVFDGRVRWAVPQIFVEQAERRVSLYCRPGTGGKRPHRAFIDFPEQLATGEWEYRDFEWQRHHVLWLQLLDRFHSLGLFWTDAWEFRGWYVNLQEPVRQSPLGFDTGDHALDVTVAPDGSWTWKDEDHLARLVELDVFSKDEATSIRAEGERVMEEWPFPTGWEDWRPDPAWPVPTLPEGWDVV